MTLKQKIELAFAAVPAPDDDNITIRGVTHPDARAVAQYFQGKTWRDIGAGEARERHAALTFFTREALHHYMPAFMLASLDAYDIYDLIPESIRVDLEYVGAHRSHFPVRMADFNHDQKRVITEFLREMERRGAGSSEDAIGYLNEDPADTAFDGE